MTTIATDGLTLAADSMMSAGTVKCPNTVQKIINFNGRIYAYAGARALMMPWVEWFDKGADFENTPKSTPYDAESAMWVFSLKEAWEVEMDVPRPQLLDFPASIGSGKDFALGAMSAGATPQEAVRIATQWDVYSGKPVTVCDLKSFELVLPHVA